ncbi:MAG: glycosyltransferase family 4 protein [Bdellovibrionales bacterium]|nr:glycosyltransferase family 4 protein [Bdellovibrionales bacterium]
MFAKRRPLPKQLNICMVASKFSPFEVTTTESHFLWPVARGLAQLGHKITVLTQKHPEHKTEINLDEVQIYFLAECPTNNAISFPKMVEQKFNQLQAITPFDVVHSFDQNGFILGKLKAKNKFALIYDVEATQLSQLFSILGMAQESLPSLLSTAVNITYKFLTTYIGKDRSLLKTADAIFVTSPPQRLALERYYMYPEFKTYLIPFGVEIGDLSAREKSAELYRKLKLPDNCQIVVTVTDMTELAETKSLLRAFEKVVIKRPHARLLILGNGPLFKKIEYEMLSLALGNRVLFTGPISSNQLADYISLADILVSLSARTSGFEPSLLEAMAQKKVVIGSEVSPIATLVENGINGFLIRPADVSTLEQLINQVLSGEVDTTHLGEKAREKVVKLFEAKRMVKKTLQAYHGALKTSGFFK